MVGRADELAELVDAWAHPSAGRGTRTVVVTGPAGTGKSLLVATVLQRLRPAAVLSGRARVHTPAPYDWLAAVLTGRDGLDLPVPADALAWLAQHPDAPRERYTPGALLRLAVRVVRALVGTGPAVLVVEDLHALDPASLNLVGELGPLAVDEVAAVLRQVYPVPLPPEVATAVWQRTGGNPYWLTQLLDAAEGRDPAALVGTPLPEHLRLDGAGPAPDDVDLTAREIEVLGCLAAGMSNKQVARRLDISIRTVAVHVSNLLRKTRSASRTEAALWAVRHRRLPGN